MSRPSISSLIDYLPGLQSYRGRYLLLAGLMALSLLTAGFIGYRHVSTVGEQQLALIQQRASAIALTHDSLEQLQNLRQQIHLLLINPPLIDGSALMLSVTHLRSASARLAETPWLKNQEDLANLAKQITQDARQLEQHVARMVQLRGDRALWFPALGPIEQQMLPANRAASDLINLMLDEVQDQYDTPDSRLTNKTLMQLQNNWRSITAELRLLIANRFGIFSSDPIEGIDGRAGNIRTYLGEIARQLDSLEDLRQRNRLGFIASSELDTLRAHIEHWQRSFETALQQISEPAWRADIQYLQFAITPLLRNTEQRLSGIRLELDVQSARNITDMTDLSGDLARLTAFIALVGTAFLISTYFMFNQLLIKPIRQTTHALKQEAQGIEIDAELSTRVRETEDLISAFEEMRKQVRSRQSHLDHLAHHDNLTGLPNRLLFRDRLEHAVSLANRSNSQLAVMFLDLDRFKQINDSLGHATGDQLLQIAARRLLDLMRDSDTVARFGGDEFAILTEDLRRREEVTRLAERVLQALEEPFVIDGRPLHISTSIGITLCPSDDTNPEGLLQGADAAMYEAKRAGKGLIRFFTAEMTEQATEYLNLETHLRAAVLEQQFELHFQPVTDATGTQLRGCEALLRWEHPEDGYISPEQFIPVLDDMGQMGQVSQWILSQVHQQQQTLDDNGYGHIDLAINLTARLLHDERFASHLLQALDERKPDPSRLVIEITEDTLTRDLEAAERVLQQLKQLGVRIALDDFGTGQSSLQHLRRYPFDIVKIDREFIRDIPQDPNDVDLVRAITQLSHAFGMRVIAEGVETRDQLEMLQSMGCDHLQGYLISRPLPAERLADHISSHFPRLEQA